jgi:hypothetical protein
MQGIRCWSVAAMLVAALILPFAAAAAEEETFSVEELDQMLAPIALHPDALLSQMLMAATYPTDVAEAVKWSAAHPDQDGDAAVEAVEREAWDPSVKSLVAFPQLLAMMGDHADWVKDVGDAFLAEPEHVMDRIQFLRNKSKEAGYLESNEQQTVTFEDPPAPEESSAPATTPTRRWSTACGGGRCSGLGSGARWVGDSTRPSGAVSASGSASACRARSGGASAGTTAASTSTSIASTISTSTTASTPTTATRNGTTTQIEGVTPHTGTTEAANNSTRDAKTPTPVTATGRAGMGRGSATRRGRATVLGIARAMPSAVETLNATPRSRRFGIAGPTRRKDASSCVTTLRRATARRWRHAIRAAGRAGRRPVRAIAVGRARETAQAVAPVQAVPTAARRGPKRSSESATRRARARAAAAATVHSAGPAGLRGIASP